MTQADNTRKINNDVSAHVYRFPSWYQPKPVQTATETGTQTGTDPVQFPASQADGSRQGSEIHPAPVPEMCTGNGVCCTGNDGLSPHEQSPQPFANAVSEQACVPEVPEVPFSETYKSPLSQHVSASPKELVSIAQGQESTQYWSTILQEAFWVCETPRHADALQAQGQVTYLPGEIWRLRDLKARDPATFPEKLCAVHQAKQVFEGLLVAPLSLCTEGKKLPL